MNPIRPLFVPCTPAGTLLMELAAKTEDTAWRKLMKAAAHMPYRNKAEFVVRGYTVWETQPSATKTLEPDSPASTELRER